MKKLLFFCSSVLSVFSMAACDGASDERMVPSYIYIDRQPASSVFVVEENDYQTDMDDSLCVVRFHVVRSNMAGSGPFTVGVKVLDDAVSGTEQLPAEAYAVSGLLNFEEGQQSALLELELDLKYLHRDANRDRKYSLHLTLDNPSAFELDPEKSKLRVLLDTERLLKDQGLYYKWNLDFADDFDGSGPMVGYNTDSWGLTNSAGHNNIGFRRAETMTRENGVLVCGTYRDPAHNDEILSSHMYHRKEYLHARFEFRARIEEDPYECVGGVILTWPNHTTGAWPRDGELDIYETFGTTPGPLTFVHYGTADGSGGWNDTQVSMRHPVPRAEWTVMAMEWTADALRLYRNGRLVWTLADSKYIPKVAHYFVVQSGPNNQKLPSGKRVNLYVDWVRIYTPAE